MADEANTPSAATSESSQRDREELEIINGGVELEVLKIDGVSERVKVRQLPIALLPQWRENQKDEAFIVELLCDKIDRSTAYNLANAQIAESRLQNVLSMAKLEEMEPIQKRLTSLRTEIEVLDRKQRWSDTLTHDSVKAIRELGLRLNKKKAIEQVKRNADSGEAMLEVMRELGLEKSSSSSQESAAAIPAT